MDKFFSNYPTAYPWRNMTAAVAKIYAGDIYSMSKIMTLRELSLMPWQS
ncbi:MAG: hypothetical protein ACI88A_002191 [Paraglaciecola sp.]|jgi:hypothetical protein